MSHEPECPMPGANGITYCICAYLRAAYTRGFNDHARTVEHGQDTHSAYRQHGEGENP